MIFKKYIYNYFIYCKGFISLLTPFTVFSKTFSPVIVFAASAAYPIWSEHDRKENKCP